MKYKEIILKVLTECGRLLLGVVFIFSGFVKAVDPVGGAIKIDDYLSAFGMNFLKPLSVLISFNLSAIEFTLGVCMLLGVYRRYASLLTLLFMAFMTPLTLYLALFDPVSDCGCFGDAVVITNWETFFKNIVLLAASALVFMNNQRIWQVYTFKAYWFVALFSYLFCIGFSYWNYNHLPIMDFRPYKVGSNIVESMEIPEGEPEDEYEYSFLYKKDDVIKEFPLDAIPDEGSGWTFVDSKTKLIKEGYQPPITDFSIYNQEDDDVTDMILGSPAVLLLIAPKLEDADDDRIDEIINVYDYAEENNITFYGVTGSSPQAVSEWSNNTGAEYPFLYADDVVLKTIIRSNPGLVLLKEGTILAKWHYLDIPEEEQLDEIIGGYLNGTYRSEKEDGRFVFFLLTFTIPLLLVWIYDYFRNRRRKKDK